MGTFHDKSLGSTGHHSRPGNLVIWKCYQTSKSSCHACSYMQSLLEEQMGLATNQKEAGDHSGSTTPTLERLTCWETCRFIGTAQPATPSGFCGVTTSLECSLEGPWSTVPR